MGFTAVIWEIPFKKKRNENNLYKNVMCRNSKCSITFEQAHSNQSKNGHCWHKKEVGEVKTKKVWEHIDANTQVTDKQISEHQAQKIEMWTKPNHWEKLLTKQKRKRWLKK